MTNELAFVLADMANKYSNKTANLLSAACAEHKKASYNAGVIDGAVNFSYTAYMAGAKAMYHILKSKSHETNTL